MRNPSLNLCMRRVTHQVLRWTSMLLVGTLPMVGCGGDPKGDPCAGVECDDGNECTEDACNPSSGACDYVPVADGAFCQEGACQSGACLPISSVFPCSQPGILEAIAVGGGPHAFACEGDRTVRTTLEIVIDNDVILDGLDALTVDGRGDHRVFLVPEGVTAELRRFTVTGGYGGGSAEDCGGGIKVAEGTLTLTRTTLTQNEIHSANGAGICNDEGTLELRESAIVENLMNAGDGAGLYSRRGLVTLLDSTVSDNAIASDGEGTGIYQEDGTLVLTRSSVSRNRLLDDDRAVAAIYNGAGSMTLTQTTVSGNGIGIYNAGQAELIESSVSGNAERGIMHGSKMLTLTDGTVSENGKGGIQVGGFAVLERTTVSRNTAGSGAGAFVVGGDLRLVNSTVSGNTAEATGGGLHNTNGGEIWMINTTLSGNSAGESGDALYSFMSATYLTNTLIDGECFLDRAPILSSGHNLESPGNTCGLDQPTDESRIRAEDLKLGPLSDNGGPTKTHALSPGSVAVDRIPSSMCEADEDQRGMTRPQGGSCDVGAFELERPR